MFLTDRRVNNVIYAAGLACLLCSYSGTFFFFSFRFSQFYNSAAASPRATRAGRWPSRSLRFSARMQTRRICCCQQTRSRTTWRRYFSLRWYPRSGCTRPPCRAESPTQWSGPLRQGTRLSERSENVATLLESKKNFTKCRPKWWHDNWTVRQLDSDQNLIEALKESVCIRYLRSIPYHF